MRAEFKRLHRDLGTTMLYATPDQLEALTMGQRIAVMREGRIVEVGTPHQLYARPGDAYAARMVGAPAINLCRAGSSCAMAARMLELPFGEIDRAVGRGRSCAGGTRCWSGVRPHDISLCAGSGPVFQAIGAADRASWATSPCSTSISRGEIVKMVLPEERALAIRPGQQIEVVIAAAGSASVRPGDRPAHRVSFSSGRERFAAALVAREDRQRPAGEAG